MDHNHGPKNSVRISWWTTVMVWEILFQNTMGYARYYDFQVKGTHSGVEGNASWQAHVQVTVPQNMKASHMTTLCHGYHGFYLCGQIFKDIGTPFFSFFFINAEVGYRKSSTNQSTIHSTLCYCGFGYHIFMLSHAHKKLHISCYHASTTYYKTLLHIWVARCQISQDHFLYFISKKKKILPHLRQFIYVIDMSHWPCIKHFSTLHNVFCVIYYF